MADATALGVNYDHEQNADSLHAALDNLWTQYLSLLDQYQDIRQQIAGDLAVGHLNLARANFSTANRIRYGKDYYDERMQASTRISVMGKETFEISHSRAFDVAFSNQVTESKSAGNFSGEEASTKEQTSGEDHQAGKGKRETNATDPLIWFGVLVPPTLRYSQTAFKDAVVKASQLAAADTEMKAMEIEIRRTRKKLSKVK